MHIKYSSGEGYAPRPLLLEILYWCWNPLSKNPGYVPEKGNDTRYPTVKGAHESTKAIEMICSIPLNATYVPKP